MLRTCKVKAAGFTMIELLTVVAIISILVTILMPSLNRAILLGRKAKSAAFVQELTGASQSYQKDSYYFPGIRYPKVLQGNVESGSRTGSLTGGQVLAASVFGLYYTNVTDGNVDNDGVTKTAPGTYTANQYVSYTRAKVIDETYFDLNDQFPDPRPLLYWPAVPGNLNDINSAFRYADNCDEANSIPSRYSQFSSGTAASPAGLLTAAAKTQWLSYITNANMGKTSAGLPVAWNYDTFMIDGPSMDRIYFNIDDVGNFGK